MSESNLAGRGCLRAPIAVALFLCLAGGIHAQWVLPNPVATIQQQADGVLLIMQTGALRLHVCTDSMVHVVYAAFPEAPNYVVTKTAWPAVKWTMQDKQRTVTLSTASMHVAVNRRGGTIAYSDAAGKKLMQEGPNTLTPVTVNGEKTYRSEAFIGLWGSTEAFYGLGQHQSGVWNYHGESVDMAQDNTNIAVPLLLSSNGYGIFWNNSSRSRFNNRFVHALYISSELYG